MGCREFYGLNFKVNKNTLVPRPETELIVKLAINSLKLSNSNKELVVADIGTGSGNIIVSIAKELKKSKFPFADYKLLGIDIFKKILSVAKQNAKYHGVDEKIKFLQGNLLKPILKKIRSKKSVSAYLILANLPYLSEKIYFSASKSVKKYEPKSALYSQKSGLSHYEKLFKQIKSLVTEHEPPIAIIIEISPEQKPLLLNLVKKYFPDAKTKFEKDLAGKWRACKIVIAKISK